LADKFQLTKVCSNKKNKGDNIELRFIKIIRFLTIYIRLYKEAIKISREAKVRYFESLPFKKNLVFKNLFCKDFIKGFKELAYFLSTYFLSSRNDKFYIFSRWKQRGNIHLKSYWNKVCSTKIIKGFLSIKVESHQK